MGGEINYLTVDDKEDFDQGKIAAAQRNNKVVVVGYALTSKKVKSFLQPKFERLARYLISSLFRVIIFSEYWRRSKIDFFGFYC